MSFLISSQLNWTVAWTESARDRKKGLVLPIFEYIAYFPTKNKKKNLITDEKTHTY